MVTDKEPVLSQGKTGNCTSFHEALCQSNGLFEISSKRSQQAERVEIEADSEEILSCEAMLIQLDEESPNDLLDNVLFYHCWVLSKTIARKVDM